MKLERIIFHAFKSLLNKELIITDNCIGFVGINESGKSNILDAIRVLGNERKLTAADTPRMAKENVPSISYHFRLATDEYKFLQTSCKGIFQKYVQGFDEEVITADTVVFNIEYDKKLENEERYFTIPGINIDNNLMISLKDKVIKNYPVLTQDGFKEITDCVVITKDDFKLHEELEQKMQRLAYLRDELVKIQNMTNEEIETGDENASTDVEANETNTDFEDVISNNFKIIDLQKEIDLLQEEVKDYKLPTYIKSLDKKNIELLSSTNDAMNNKKTNEMELKVLQKIKEPNPQQTVQLNEYEEMINKLDGLITSNNAKIVENKRCLQLFKEPISEKYSDSNQEFVDFIYSETENILESLLPSVVFWEYNDKYLQKSEVVLKEILDSKDLSEISRPLLNIFRISYNINSITELQMKIKESQDDLNERSKITKKLTENINRFLKSIWTEYNQEILIRMEKDHLLFQIFDPSHDEPSYYSMNERSQGCRTFISFLLTIGVEAKQGVLKDTILLLDEPETHLHPTGIKNMLQELIKISENNLVVYATHSLFMIDRSKFDRHIIIKKEKELTELQPSVRDRIGYFMQEEVLYGALEPKHNEDFNSTNSVNFVFEGDGDAFLFEYAYNSVLEKDDTPFIKELCSFYHGGGCGNIEKYLKTRPIQLGTKWIFILDNDKPAIGLAEFIKKKYGEYPKDVFVFHYHLKDIKDIELEDLLPDNIKHLAVNNTFSPVKDVTFEETKYKDIIKDTNLFSQQFDILCKEHSVAIKDIKGKFKKILNSKIKEAIANKPKFKDEYKIYYTWLTDTMKEIKNIINQPTSDK
jgi:predicted ATP-dependent endonuclease of OLD family